MADTKSDLVMNDELVSTCNAVGNYDHRTKIYTKSEQCEAYLVDIRRFMRIDDTKSQQTKEFSTRRSLSKMSFVTDDIVPILKQHCEDDPTMFKTVVYLMTNLSVPTILLFGETLPTDKLEKQRYLELVEINRSIKTAFGSSILIWKPFFNFMTEFLSAEWEDRDIDQRELFQNILLFIRNLLHIPLDTQMDRNVPGELNSHDKLISVFDKAGILDLILLLVSSEDEVGHYCFHILEVVSALLREQSPEFLAKCYSPSEPDVDNKSRSAVERDADDHELQLLVRKEKEKSQKAQPFYSRFREATFQVTNMKSLSDKNMIVHKLPQNLEFTTLGLNKQNMKKNKRQADLLDSNFCQSDGPNGLISKSPPHITRMLSKFCHEFLKSYNMLMEVTEMNLARAKSTSNDETYYLWSAHFFMEFNRFSQKDISSVSKTFSVKAMHDFHTYITKFIETLTSEKKIFLPWSRRLHYALKAYRELIFTLAFSESSKNPEFADVNKAVKTTIFYEDDYRELLLKLIKEFNPIKMSRSYLIDLVMTNHIFLKLLKVYCASLPKVEVKVKVKKPKKKRQPKRKVNADKPVDLEECWDNIETGLTAALKGMVVLPSAEDNEDVLPLDPTVDFDDHVQKLAIVQRLNRLLKEEKSATAVSLFRNAREAWPDEEDNLFGSKDCQFEEEMESLKKILHYESLPDDEDEQSKEEEKRSEDEGRGSGSEEDEDIKVETTSRKPNQLNYDNVFRKYCHTKVIQAYALLLKDFEHNSVELNHAIVKIFHRIAYDLELYAMFFQASLFRIFQNILKVGSLNDGPNELVQFVKFIIKKFVSLVPKNDLLMVELLFWKSANLAQQVASEYSEIHTTAKEEEEDFAVEVQREDVNLFDKLFNEAQ